MRIKCLAQGNNILLPGFEPSTSVSKTDILTNRPICILISSFRLVPMVFYNFSAPIKIHICFWLFSHQTVGNLHFVKLLDKGMARYILESSMYLAIPVYKQILNTFGSILLLALYINKPVYTSQMK